MNCFQEKTPGAERTGGSHVQKHSLNEECAQSLPSARVVEENRPRLNAVSNDAKRNMALAFRRYTDAINAGDEDEAADAKARFLKYSAQLKGGV